MSRQPSRESLERPTRTDVGEDTEPLDFYDDEDELLDFNDFPNGEQDVQNTQNDT